MNEVTVEVKGLDELQRKLEEMAPAVAKKVIRTTLREVGQGLAERMAAAAPKGPPDPGFLSEHFGVKVGYARGGDLAGSAYVGPQGRMYYPDRGELSRGLATGKYAHKGGVVPVASVARFLEFGTSKMPAHPFMTAAFDGYEDEALEQIIADIKEEIVKFTR